MSPEFSSKHTCENTESRTGEQVTGVSSLRAGDVIATFSAEKRVAALNTNVLFHSQDSLAYSVLNYYIPRCLHVFGIGHVLFLWILSFAHLLFYKYSLRAYHLSVTVLIVEKYESMMINSSYLRRF